MFSVIGIILVKGMLNLLREFVFYSFLMLERILYMLFAINLIASEI